MSRSDAELLSALKLAMVDTWWVPPEQEIGDTAELLYITGRSGDTTVLQMRADDAQQSAVLSRFMLRSQGCFVRVQTYPEDSPASFAALRENGFHPGHNHDICILRLADDTPRQSRFSAEAALTWEAQQELLEITDQVFGRKSNYSEAGLQHLLKALQQPTPRVARFVARDPSTGVGLGAGGISLFDELGVAFLFGGGVIEEHRGQGVYSTLLAARLKLARERGIEVVGIFARHGTSAPIVSRLGFQKLGEMQYWEHASSM